LTLLERAIAIATVSLLAVHARLEAQTTPSAAAGAITGHVIDSATRTPITGANVDVRVAGAPASPASTASIARAMTVTDGSFRIEGLSPGRYTVRVRALGYTPRPLPPVEVSSSGVDVGAVTLLAAAVQLQSLQVTGQRQEVQLAPDRNTYIVRDMPTTRGGTALDVLRNVPSVDVDIDNIVSLRGNSGVIVQINGRPSPLKPAQLGSFLAQLPADIVDKVEIVTNPSARDDPEGVAGIINIVLKEKPEAGKSGGLTLGGGTTGQVTAGGNAGYEQGPLSFYGSYGFMRDDRPRKEAVFRQNLFDNPMTFLDEAATRTQIPLIHTLTGSLDYAPTASDAFTLESVYSTRVEYETYSVLYRNLNATRDPTGLGDRFTRGTNHEFSFESALSWKHAFADNGHKLSSELRVTRDGEGGPTSSIARTIDLSGTSADTTARERQTPWEHPNEYSLKADYVRPFSNGIRLETGYKGSLLDFHTTLNTQIFDAAQSAYVPDPTRISDFTYRQLVNAGYGMLGADLGKFQLQGGARVERATTRFDARNGAPVYDNAYNSFFPSGLVAYHIDDEHQLKLSYSTRIRRPDADLLDPTPHLLDPLNISRGNPYLKPEYIRALEFGIQRSTDRMTVQVTPFYRHTLDAIRTIRSIDTTGVSTRTFANVATSNAYGTDVTVAISGGKLSGFIGGSGFRQVSDAANLSPGFSARTFGWTARTNVTFRVSPTVDVQSLVSYQAPMIVEQGRNAARTRFSIAARQKLMNDQMSLTFRLVDPFNTSLERSTTVDPAFYQVSDRRRLMRGLVVTANWIFGKSKKEDDRQIDTGDSGGP
jgi:outer membrane receptor protein involved in Fe transport